VILAAICVHSEQMHTNHSPVSPAGRPALSSPATGSPRGAAETQLKHQIRTDAQRPCQHCGGSGMLRKDGESFRTCLECLGQGLIANSNGLLLSQLRPASSTSASR
jgi:hypothetical protein